MFDRFTNPIWHLVSTLDKDRQRIAALLINGYGACRRTAYENLVLPLEQSKMVPSKYTGSQVIRERLIDEALIALLKSCHVPKIDPGGKVPDRIVSGLADVWGMFALADRNHRLKCAEPETLQASAYSNDPDEARTQVLTKWTEILGISEPNFVMDANKRWFYKEWGALSAAMITGFLKGFSTTPDEVMLKKGRSEGGSIPEHRLLKTRYMIETLVRAPLSAQVGKAQQLAPLPKPEQPHIPAQAKAQSAALRQSLPSAQQRPDGKAIHDLAPDAGPLDVIRAMVVMIQPHLVAKDAEICRRWVSQVTGIDVIQNQWTPKHIDALVRGFERFHWEGKGGEPWITKLVRDKYPRANGTRIDVKLNDDISSIFRAWTTKR